MGLGRKTTKGVENSVILLQQVDHVGSGGSTHIDLKVDDVAAAIPKIEALGGKLKKAPGYYPDKNAAPTGMGRYARSMGNAILHHSLARVTGL